MTDELVVPQVFAKMLTFAGQAYLDCGEDETASRHWLRAGRGCPEER